MMRIVVFLACLLSVLIQGCTVHSRSKPVSEKRERETEARAAALHWLELVDAGKYVKAYHAEPDRLRAATTQAQFNRSMEGRRVPFGHVVSRTFVGAAFTRKLTGSPDGEYESILFRTSFEHKKNAAERVILMKQGERWRVVDYRVY
jgi:hypothetical protein